jgi:DNA-binding response OmpR family regulator
MAPHQEMRNMATILLLEDSENLNKAMFMRLQHAGYQVLRAYDAVQATSLARRTAIDLALLDIGVPGGDGFIVAERLQEFRPTPFILVTANGDPALRRKARALGASSYLTKPITAAGLLRAVDDALTGVLQGSHEIELA